MNTLDTYYLYFELCFEFHHINNKLQPRSRQWIATVSVSGYNTQLPYPYRFRFRIPLPHSNCHFPIIVSPWSNYSRNTQLPYLATVSSYSTQLQYPATVSLPFSISRSVSLIQTASFLLSCPLVGHSTKRGLRKKNAKIDR